MKIILYSVSHWNTNMDSGNDRRSGIVLGEDFDVLEDEKKNDEEMAADTMSGMTWIPFCEEVLKTFRVKGQPSRLFREKSNSVWQKYMEIFLWESQRVLSASVVLKCYLSLI